MHRELSGLKLEDARIDAAYREKADSKRPALESALKGGLASGLLSRIIKPKLRTTEAGIIGTGTLTGGAIGQANHQNSIDSKKRAQRLLKSAMDLTKRANTHEYYPEPYHYQQQLQPQPQPASNGIMGEAIAGAGLGAVGNAAFAGKIPRWKWAGVGALSGALTGMASGKATEFMSRRAANKNDNSPGATVATLGATAGAIDGAMSPVVYKAMGTVAQRDGKLHQGVQNEVKSTPSGPIRKAFGSNTDENAFLDGVNKKKGEKFFNQKTLKASGVGMLRGGLMGATLGYGVDRLSNYVRNRYNNN